MWRPMVILVPVLLPTLVIKTVQCDNNTNDVIVRYAGHAEADVPQETKESRISSDRTTTFSTTTTTTLKPSPSPIFSTTTPSTTTAKIYEEATESVVFIPNEPPVVRLEDEEEKHGFKLQDLMSRREIIDAMDKQIKTETERPKDVVFIAEKNKDISEVRPSGRRTDAHADLVKPPETSSSNDFVNCSNLDCSNIVQTICGKKKIEGKIQYRLFLNECYFRKVNCKFKYRKNRYSKTTISKCARIGSHNAEPQSLYVPKIIENPKKRSRKSSRRNFSSRRSLAMDIKGQFCSHPCPVACSDDYDPVCAISSTGQRKVFMNHCKLDDNSCQFVVVWHKRPLSECVGGKKADLQQNRFFVAWLQRVGIVDKKGKLVTE